MSSVPSGVFSYVTTGGHSTYDDPPGSNNAGYYFYSFACGIRENGLVACWGVNSNDRATPPVGVKVKQPSGFTPPSHLGSCTQPELDSAYGAGMSACKTNPASCGITMDGACPVDETCPVCPVVESCPKIETEQVRAEGKDEGIASCRTNPTSCGIVNIPNLDTISGTYLFFVPNKPIDAVNNSVFYNVGDKIEIDLVENFQQANRFENVDLWVILEFPSTDLFYKTPMVIGDFSPIPQAFKEDLDSTQTTNRILEFEVVAGLGGDYTFSAVYVAEGKNPMTDGFFVQRSNVARLDVVLRNRH